MDYTALANELLTIRTNLLREPTNRELEKMVKGELFVLNYLASHETLVHPKELSEKMSVSTARIASLLNHMEEKKLILRLADPGDNRQIFVRLTPAGKDRIRKIKDEAIAHIALMLEALGPDDAREYIRIKGKIWRNFQEKA